MPFRFESFKIGDQSREFANEIWRLTASFPDKERYSLTSQITRAADSVYLNICEGSGKDTNIDFNRFLGISIGSLFEVVGALNLALDRGYITEETRQNMYHKAEYLGASINKFRKTLVSSR